MQREWSRRTDDNRAWRYVRRMLLAVGAAALLAFVIFPLSPFYVFTHAAHAYVPAANLGAAYEEVSFETSDGLTLGGWYVPS
jgi:hypothetical protein